MKMILHILLFLTALTVLLSCASTAPITEGPAKEEAYTFELAVDLYEAGIQSIEDSDWLGAEAHLEQAVEILSYITPKNAPPTDSITIKGQQLFIDILDILEEVYLKSSESMVVDPEFVFPEEPLGQGETDYVGGKEFHLDSIDHSVFDMPIVINDRVMRELKYLSTVVPTFMEGSLGRMAQFETMIKTKLEAAEMPTDIIYQSLIESGFKVKAYSSASASGIWQFIRATGRRYDLKSDYWFDGRRNPERATDGAIRYLTRLHNEFGDWYLAFAAYNCGETRVRRLIRKHGTRDYWELPLPRETMRYVPRIIAAAIIGHYPEQFGITNIVPVVRPETETVKVKHCISLDVAAKMIHVSDSIMRKINPEVRRWCTPPNVRTYNLRVPKGTSAAFMDAYAKMDKSKLVKWVRHRVAWGESLGIIARKYGVTVRALKSSNNIRGSNIMARQMLVIPLSEHKYAKVSKKSSKKKKKKAKKASKKRTKKSVASAKGKSNSYRVKSGDNLYTIARKFGVSLKELLSWNSLSHKSVLHVGQKLKLYGVEGVDDRVIEPKEAKGAYVLHTVKSGESLYTIANKYGITLAKLKKLNSLNRSRIYPGQELKVTPVSQAKVVAKKKSRIAKKSAPKKSNSKIRHRVRGGESIYKIALKYNVTVKDIKVWNRMKGSRIYPGQKLIIHTAQNSSGDTGSHYIVRSGDSLWSIAKKHNISIQKLKLLNNIGNRIVPGMKLRIK
ncbi:MAG: LysM peptidoglycan-binding domain-containing protein [Fibrobacterales bacterium]